MRRLFIALALCAIAAAPALAGPPSKTVAASATATVIATAPSSAAREVGDLGKVGTIHFPISCDPALQGEFERGVALLHSFFYEEARRVFTGIAEKDPECAMAHWGVAMTYYHPIWAAPDSTELALGRAAAERGVAAKKQDDRERAYVHAIHAYYTGTDQPASEAQPGMMSCHAPGVVDHRGRAACFRREMEKVSTDRPEDIDAAAFFALSLLGTAPAGDPTLANQKQAAQLLEKWYKNNPNHPGLVHYLIHSYDYPSLAPQGLGPAKAYASIAPWVPHALHMPSHIFTRLGMWKETIESNLASAEAARRYGEQHHPGAASHEQLHAMDYAMYAYLQTAQDAKAAELLAQYNAVEKTYPAVEFAAAYAFGAMPARYALERRQWKEAAALQPRPMAFWGKMPFAEGHIAYARAVGGAKSGDLAVARAAVERLSELVAASTEPRFKYFADQMDIQRQAALGLIACAEGKKDEGIALLRRAAAREDSLGKHPVSPGAMLPVRELLGEALFDAGRSAEALNEFKMSLKLNPGRFNGIYGAGRAAAAAGDREGAREYYYQLTQLAGAENPRPELAEARKLIAGR